MTFGGHVPCELEKRHGAGQSVDDENGRLLAAGFHLDEGRESRKRGLLQKTSQLCDGWSMVEGGAGQFAATLLRDGGKQHVGCVETASDAEEMIVNADKRPLQYTLPNRGQRPNHRRNGVMIHASPEEIERRGRRSPSIGGYNLM